MLPVPGTVRVDRRAAGGVCGHARERRGEQRSRLGRGAERGPGQETLTARAQLSRQGARRNSLVGEVRSGPAERIGEAEILRHEVRRPEELSVELADGIAAEGGVGDGVGRDQGDDHEGAEDGDEPDLQRHGQPQMQALTPRSRS